MELENWHFEICKGKLKEYWTKEKFKCDLSCSFFQFWLEKKRKSQTHHVKSANFTCAIRLELNHTILLVAGDMKRVSSSSLRAVQGEKSA